MAPLPKRKTARARQGERRSHLHLTAPNLTECPECHEKHLPHRVCPNCGTYRGRQVLKVKNPTTRG